VDPNNIIFFEVAKDGCIAIQGQNAAIREANTDCALTSPFRLFFDDDRSRPLNVTQQPSSRQCLQPNRFVRRNGLRCDALDRG
jgi:hypothetical protein